MVAEIPVFCTHREEGCSIIIPFESLNFHVQNECELVVRYCVCHPEGCNFKGTSSERQLHLETCVFYKLRSFISVTNRRLEQLEATVLTQQKMILDLQQQKTIKTLNNNTRIESRELDIPPMTCIKTISNIGTGITSVTHLDDTYIAGCYDGTIRTFDSMSGISGTVGFGHQLSVWSLALDSAGNKLFSGASDGNINSWSLSNSRVNLEQTVKIGNGKVYSLAVHNDLLFAGSSDGRVHIMNHKLGSVGSLVGHSGGINSVHIANNLVLTASSDKSIKIWDLATSKCLQTLSMHTSEVLDVHTRSNLLFGSTYGADIVVYDMNDYSKVKTLTGHRWVNFILKYRKCGSWNLQKMFFIVDPTTIQLGGGIFAIYNL